MLNLSPLKYEAVNRPDVQIADFRVEFHPDFDQEYQFLTGLLGAKVVKAELGYEAVAGKFYLHVKLVKGAAASIGPKGDPKVAMPPPNSK